MNVASFAVHLEQMLWLGLQLGDAVVLDNLSVHQTRQEFACCFFGRTQVRSTHLLYLTLTLCTLCNGII